MSLQHVWHELAPYWPDACSGQVPGSTSLAIAPPTGATACCLVETQQRGFLLSVGSVAVHLRVPLRIARGACMELRHRGWLLRGALTRVGTTTDAALARAAERLCASERVQQAIAHVQFTRFELIGEGAALRAQLALYGGSELRSPVPGLRRYVRLGPAQTQALAIALHAITAALHG